MRARCAAPACCCSPWPRRARPHHRCAGRRGLVRGRGCSRQLLAFGRDAHARLRRARVSSRARTPSAPRSPRTSRCWASRPSTSSTATATATAAAAAARTSTARGPGARLARTVAGAAELSETRVSAADALEVGAYDCVAACGSGREAACALSDACRAAGVPFVWCRCAGAAFCVFDDFGDGAAVASRELAGAARESVPLEPLRALGDNLYRAEAAGRQRHEACEGDFLDLDGGAVLEVRAVATPWALEAALIEGAVDTKKVRRAVAAGDAYTETGEPARRARGRFFWILRRRAPRPAGARCYRERRRAGRGRGRGGRGRRGARRAQGRERRAAGRPRAGPKIGAPPRGAGPRHTGGGARARRRRGRDGLRAAEEPGPAGRGPRHGLRRRRRRALEPVAPVPVSAKRRRREQGRAGRARGRAPRPRYGIRGYTEAPRRRVRGCRRLGPGRRRGQRGRLAGGARVPEPGLRRAGPALRGLRDARGGGVRAAGPAPRDGELARDGGGRRRRRPRRRARVHDQGPPL